MQRIDPIGNEAQAVGYHGGRILQIVKNKKGLEFLPSLFLCDLTGSQSNNHNH
jgi:hypothetical protein